MKNQQEVAAELREYLLTKVRTQTELAEKIGCSKSHISNYLRGAERISRKVADRIVELWPEIREAFILTGDGPLLHGGTVQTVTNSGSIGGSVHQSSGSDAALRAENAALREQLDREREEKARLLGIIEKTIATK